MTVKPLTASLFRRWLALFLLGGLLCSAAAAKEVDYLSFATEDEANTTEIFSRASPSVVYVTNTALRRSLFSLNVQEIPRGSGTGFVWDETGLIVTNFHVIAGAHRLSVTFTDRTTHDAEVVGVAPSPVMRLVEGSSSAMRSLPKPSSSPAGRRP